MKSFVCRRRAVGTLTVEVRAEDEEDAFELLKLAQPCLYEDVSFEDAPGEPQGEWEIEPAAPLPGGVFGIPCSVCGGHGYQENEQEQSFCGWACRENRRTEHGSNEAR